MSKIELKAESTETYKKVKEIINETVIIKRQLELEYGKWDFVVFGAKDKNHTVIREGFAKQVTIYRSSLYMATVGMPGLSVDECQREGIPIEEFTNGDVPEEFKGLEIFQVDPIRPLSITVKKNGPPMDKAADTIQKEYEGRNIAIIQSPDEAYWGISILKYLNECDRYFPDVLTEAIKKGKLPINANFVHFDSGANRGKTLN